MNMYDFSVYLVLFRFFFPQAANHFLSKEFEYKKYFLYLKF